MDSISPTWVGTIVIGVIGSLIGAIYKINDKRIASNEAAILTKIRETNNALQNDINGMRRAVDRDINILNERVGRRVPMAVCEVQTNSYLHEMAGLKNWMEESQVVNAEGHLKFEAKQDDIEKILTRMDKKLAVLVSKQGETA